MVDPAYAPVMQDTDGCIVQPPVVAPLHTAAEEEQLAVLYAELKPLAVEAYLNYFLARTPAHLQQDMKDLISDDIAVPPTPPPEAFVAAPTNPVPPPPSAPPASSYSRD